MVRGLPSCFNNRKRFVSSVCADHTEDVERWQAGVVKLPAVELQADDGKHEDGEEQEKADLEQRDHGLHDGLQHNLQALKYSQSKGHPIQEERHSIEMKSSQVLIAHKGANDLELLRVENRKVGLGS